MGKKVSSSFFEKKEPKKLSLTGGFGEGGAKARGSRSFFGYFFFKKSNLFSQPSR
jgi:hypothetical protein